MSWIFVFIVSEGGQSAKTSCRSQVKHSSSAEMCRDICCAAFCLVGPRREESEPVSYFPVLYLDLYQQAGSLHEIKYDSKLMCGLRSL